MCDYRRSRRSSKRQLYGYVDDVSNSERFDIDAEGEKDGSGQLLDIFTGTSYWNIVRPNPWSLGNREGTLIDLVSRTANVCNPIKLGYILLWYIPLFPPQLDADLSNFLADE